jgi:hypothetical protein
MNVELIFTLIDAVYRADIYAGPILHPNAGLDNYISHATAPL